MDGSPSGSSTNGIFQTRVLEWVATSEASYRKKGGVRELLAEEKKGLFLGQETFQEGSGRGFIMQIAPSGGVWGGDRSGEGPGENNLVGANQKTSDKQIKTFWGRLSQHLG